jgi:hypothetical protein
MKTFQQWLETATQPNKFETDQPIQQQIDQLVTTLQTKLSTNPYMDVSKNIDFYSNKLNYTYGIKAAEYWQRKTAAMIQNMRAQQQAFSQKSPLR